MPRLRPAHTRRCEQIRGKHLHCIPLAALRLVDGDGSPVQERGPHARGKGDERLFLVRLFDLYDGRGRDLRVFGPHHMQAAKARLATIAQIDNLRAFDQAACFEVEPFLAVFQWQLDPVTYQRLTFEQRVFRCPINRPECVDQPDTRRVAPDQHRRTRHQVNLYPLAPDHAVVFL